MLSAPLLTIHEVAELLKVREATVRAWINDNDLRAIKFGREWRVALDSGQPLRGLRGDGKRAAAVENSQVSTAPSRPASFNRSRSCQRLRTLARAAPCIARSTSGGVPRIKFRRRLIKNLFGYR